MSDPLFRTLKGRAWALHTSEAQIFLRALDPEKEEKFKSCYLNGDFESPVAKDILSHLQKISSIARIVMQDTTSSVSFEYLCHKKPVDSPIDAHFPQGKAAKAIYQRLLSLRKNLPDIIRKDIEKRGLNSYRILNIGSGPSHEMIEILQENPDLVRVIHVTCIEPDQHAINIGLQRVNECGLTSNFSFLQKKLQDFRGGWFDLLLLIGILCPMSKEVSIKILRNLVSLSGMVETPRL